jgi:hypothetical protein
VLQIILLKNTGAQVLNNNYMIMNVHGQEHNKRNKKLVPLRISLQNLNSPIQWVHPFSFGVGGAAATAWHQPPTPI